MTLSDIFRVVLIRYIGQFPFITCYGVGNGDCWYSWLKNFVDKQVSLSLYIDTFLVCNSTFIYINIRPADKSALVQIMAWRSSAPSHYLKQCWPRYTVHIEKCLIIVSHGFLLPISFKVTFTLLVHNASEATLKNIGKPQYSLEMIILFIRDQQEL